MIQNTSQHFFAVYLPLTFWASLSWGFSSTWLMGEKLMQINIPFSVLPNSWPFNALRWTEVQLKLISSLECLMKLSWNYIFEWFQWQYIFQMSGERKTNFMDWCTCHLHFLLASSSSVQSLTCKLFVFSIYCCVFFPLHDFLVGL